MWFLKGGKCMGLDPAIFSVGEKVEDPFEPLEKTMLGIMELDG